MLRLKSRLILMAGLLALAALGLFLGWGAHALVDMVGPLAPATPSAQAQTTPTPTAGPTVTPPAEVLPTSTLAPQEQIIVQLGESLYAVCRRYCPQNWGPDALDDALRQYSEQVAERNNLSWNDMIKGYVIFPGDVLNMPPCPAR